MVTTTIYRLAESFAILAWYFGLEVLGVLIISLKVILVFVTETPAGDPAASLLFRSAEIFKTAAEWIKKQRQGPGPPSFPSE